MDEVLGKEGTLGRETEKEMILTRYLGEALIQLNPGLPEEAYRDAIRQIVDVNLAQSMLVINQEKDTLYKNGVLVSYRNDSPQGNSLQGKNERLRKTLRIFDFDNPDNNHFLVVRELWMDGDQCLKGLLLEVIIKCNYLEFFKAVKISVVWDLL
jgi:type I restriction enzyme R subunit